MCKDEKEYETVNFESLKGKEKDIQVDISVETPKSKNVKTPSPSERVEDFTAQWKWNIKSQKWGWEIETAS